MTITLAKWTIDEYHSMIESGLLDNRQVELLKEGIVEMPPEGEAHAYFSSEAEEYLRELLKTKATIRSGKPITLPDHSEPEPDIAIAEKLGREYLTHHPYPENIFWLIEYSNSSLEKAEQCGAGLSPSSSSKTTGNATALRGVSPMSNCFKKS